MTNDDNNYDDHENLFEIIVYDYDDNEYKKRVYADEKGRWIWIARSRDDVFNGNGEYIRCDRSQRKDILKLIAEIKRDNEEETQYRVKDRIVTKEEYQEFRKRLREKLI
jgi:hypothetical protein